MKNGRKTWFHQSIRIYKKKTEKLSHERKQKKLTGHRGKLKRVKNEDVRIIDNKRND